MRTWSEHVNSSVTGIQLCKGMRIDSWIKHHGKAQTGAGPQVWSTGHGKLVNLGEAHEIIMLMSSIITEDGLFNETGR